MSTESQLSRRLGFMRMDAAAIQALRSLAPQLRQEMPVALDSFYDQVRAFPETRRFFADDPRIRSAKARQESHWGLVAAGDFGPAYEEAVAQIGRTHARIGLEPRWHIGGYALLLEHLTRAMVRKAWPTGFGAKPKKGAELADQLSALIKAVMLDMDMAISVYLETSEAERARVERETLEKERAVVRTFGAALSQLADGDLTCRVEGDIPPEYAQLGSDFNAAIGQMRAVLANVSSAAGAIQAGSDEIAGASDDLSQRTEQQAAGLEQTAAALEQVTSTVRRSAEGARQASDLVTTTKGEAEHSGEVVRDAIQAMGQIENSSKQISQIVGVIDEIAFQTNLLALNAGVEAARAGDAGRGFAVVASEVRALAQRSADAAKEIKALISASTGQVGEGVKLVADTGEALGRIVGRVSEIDGLVSEIAASSKEQAVGLAEVNTAVNQMDQVTQQNAAMVEQATAATHSLRSEALELARMISRFRLGGEAEAAPPRLSGPAPVTERTPAPAARPPVLTARDRLASFIAPAPRGSNVLAARQPASEEWEEF